MKWIHVAWVESDSEPGKQHEIKRHPTTGVNGCGCHAYRFAKGSGAAKTCKHLEALRSAVHVTMAVTSRQVVAGETFTVRRAITFGKVEEASR